MGLNNKTDNELMQEFANGSLSAFEEITNRYKKKLFNYLIISLIKDKDWAEDIVQDTLLKVYLCKLTYKPTYQFSTWIYTICRNLALNSKRGKRTIDMDTAFYSNEPFDNSKSIAESIEDEEIDCKIKESLLQLPDKYRDIITLRYLQELSYGEISDITGIGENTLKSHCKRGLDILRKLLER